MKLSSGESSAAWNFVPETKSIVSLRHVSAIVEK
jgi:hypothetical protein